VASSGLKSVKEAITHLKLDQANPGKLQKLDELAAEHRRVSIGQKNRPI